MSEDVRRRGFRRRTPVEEVLRLIDERVRPLGPESVPLLEAGGRILARDAAATVDVPSFARAAMDGYAVRAEESFGATPDDPRVLRVAGASRPGAPCEEVVERGTAVRIMTGAPLPEGADAVVPFEWTEARGADRVALFRAVAPGQHVGAVGEDVRRGDLVLRAGRRLRPQDLGVLSSLGFAQVTVFRRPRVSILVTGDELLPAGSVPAPPRIADANGPMLLELCRRDGALPEAGPIVPDGREPLRAALEHALGAADCVLLSGATSVGVEDHAPEILRALGELPVHGVAMRPSSPAGVGLAAGKPVFLLPGNPVSCLCAYDFFAGRALRRLGGRPAGWPHITLRLPLARKIVSELGRTDYVRVRIENRRVVPLAVRGAAILSSTTRADGFVIVPAQAEGYPEGAPVDVRLYAGR